MGYIISGIIGLILGLALIIVGIRGGTIIVSRQDTGQSAAVTGKPNGLMIILGIIVGISSIVSIVKGAG
jgi:hypothetical protein